MYTVPQTLSIHVLYVVLETVINSITTVYMSVFLAIILLFHSQCVFPDGLVIILSAVTSHLRVAQVNDMYM